MRAALRDELREGAEPGEDARHRLCAVTRERKAIEDLIRFVADPAGQVVPDLLHKLPGRGVWVSLSKAKVAEAIRTKAFSRGLKRPVEADATLADLIEAQLEHQALQALSIANKAGALILGFERVLAAVEKNDGVTLIHASDAGADGVAKLRSQRPSVTLFSGVQLSLALGRPNVVHGALIDAPATANFIERTVRLTRYRSE